MTGMLSIYFAHPISQYNTAEERRLVQDLEERGWYVVNPSDDEHQQAVANIKRNTPSTDAGKAIMQYFVDVCSGCHAVAFSTFPDGSIGAGVAKEVNSFIERHSPIYHLRWNDIEQCASKDIVTDMSTFKILSVDETRAMLKKLMPTYQSSAPTL